MRIVKGNPEGRACVIVCMFSYLKRFAFLGQQSLNVSRYFFYDVSRVVSDQTELSFLLKVDLKNINIPSIYIYISIMTL